MSGELVPQSVSADGNLRVTFVPGTANPKSAAILNGVTAKSLTYSLTPGGLNRASGQDSITDDRLTIRQAFTRAGRDTEGLDLQYVFGGADEIARDALTRGTTGYIVVRYVLPNETDYAASQEVDIIPVQCGRQRKDAPAANAVFTMSQTMFVTGLVQEDVALIA